MLSFKAKTGDVITPKGEESSIKIKKEISSIHKKKIITGAICILAAIMVVTLLLPKAMSAMSSKYNIVTLKTDVRQGEVIVADDIAVISITDKEVAKQFVADATAVVGKYAAVNIYKGDYISTAKLWEENQLDVYNSLQDGYMTMSVTFDTFSTSMSGGIQKGDIVSVFGILNAIKPEEIIDAESYNPISILRNELRYVKVVDVSNEQSGRALDNAAETVAGEDALALSTVTLLVNEQQAKLLVDFENAGYLHLALSYRGDNDTAEAYQKQQQAYIDEMLLLQAEANVTDPIVSEGV